MMRIVKPKVELWKPKDNVSHVARCARVCYALKTGASDEKRYEDLKKDGHLSMFRHESWYFIVDKNDDVAMYVAESYENCPYIEFNYDRERFYVATNGQFLLEHEQLAKHLMKYAISAEYFSQTEMGFHLMRYSFNVITQISTSRELNRVSPNNISEQSTRYCNYSRGKFEGMCAICQPHWFDCCQEEVTYYKYDWQSYVHYLKNDDGEWHPWDNHPVRVLKYKQSNVQRYLLDNMTSCKVYLDQIEDKMLPQDARGGLPLDLATECVYTYSISQWRAILDLRYYGTTGAPHPNAKIIASMIRDELLKLGYDFRPAHES